VSWQQVGGSVTLVVADANTQTLKATAPTISQTTTFKFTAISADGVSSSDLMTLQNLAFLTPSNYTIVFSGTKDTVIKGYRNKVVFNFDFNVSQYLEMKISLGDETYSTVTNPLNLYVRNSSELVLDIGKVTEIGVGAIIPKIEADEILLNGNCKRVLKKDFNVC
jgi:hypothetical protein